MTERLKSLREKRARIVTEMRGVTDLAQKEKRDLSGDELAKHGELFKAQDECRAQIEAEERQIELDRSLASTQAPPSPAPTIAPAERSMVAFRNWLRSGSVAGEGAQEFRDLQAGSMAQGGFLVAPQQFVATLIQAVDDLVFMRKRATKFSVASAASLGAASLDADPADADWTTEIATGSNDTAMAFGKRELTPRPFAKRIKVSKKLLQISTVAVDALIRARLAYKFAITEEKGYLLGSGANQPLGVFTASNDGIPVGRDVSNGNTTTAITFDGLIAAKYSLKGPYHRNAAWMFHRNAVEQIAKIKDLDGQYIWRQSVRDGEPDRILQLPYDMSEYVPNTFTTGLYVGIIGDFSNYWIADAIDLQIQRLTELYAESNQDGFIGRKESDGMPVLAEAFARVKLA